MPILHWDKWSKYKVLKGSTELTTHLPETHLMKESSFWSLLKQDEKMIIKPIGSCHGNGVIQVSSLGNHRYEIHAGSKVTQLAGETITYDYLKKMDLTNCIVQQRIPLARINGCPFDLRVMVQRKKSTDWMVTGILAKVAGKGYIITNIKRSKGTVFPVKKAIELSSLKGLSSDTLLSEIEKVAVITAKQLGHSYSWVRTMGIDIGLDEHGKIWIIEVNFRPAASLFRKLEDKSMYQRIISYMKASKKKAESRGFP